MKEDPKLGVPIVGLIVVIYSEPLHRVVQDFVSCESVSQARSHLNPCLN